MIHIGKLLRKYVSRSNFKNRDIAEKLNITEVALYRIYNKQNINTSIIFKILDILKLPYTAMLEEYDSNVANEDLEYSKLQILSLKEQLIQKEEQIKLLKEIIRLYKDANQPI